MSTVFKGGMRVNINCNASLIELSVELPAMTVHYTMKLLEYICFESSTNFSETGHIYPDVPHFGVQSHYSQETNATQPSGTVCTVRGCYEELEGWWCQFTTPNNCTIGSTVPDNCNTGVVHFLFACRYM